MRRKTFAIIILAAVTGLLLLFSACGGSTGATGASAAGAAQDAASGSVASETQLVKELTGGDHVYFVKGDTHYHLYPDCSQITGTAQEGTVAQALAANPGSSLCVTCISRALTDGAAGGTAIGNTNGTSNGSANGTTGTGTNTPAQPPKPASGVIQPTTKYTAKPATVNAADGLNMRKGPGTNYDKIAGIPDKTKVSDIGNTSAQPGWVYIQYNSTEGWVSKQYLKY